MKKITLLLVLAAVLALAGCGREPVPTEPAYSIPTPPSISETKTPLEQLNEALDKTKSAVSAAIEYGKVSMVWDTEEKSEFSQDISSEVPFNWETVYTQLPDFPVNDDLLAMFCAYPLRAIPSNDGTIRYEVTELTAQELAELMGRSPEGDILGTVSITVDADGFLARIEFTAEQQDADGKPISSVTWFLEVTEIES